jgi:hypothetical protein
MKVRYDIMEMSCHCLDLINRYYLPRHIILWYVYSGTINHGVDFSTDEPNSPVEIKLRTEVVETLG